MARSTRQAGVLLHPTSLPSRFGVGDLGPAADAFLDWASNAGLRLWQILPLGPTGPHHSPYDGLSAFAGDPLLVSPEWLVQEGLLPAGALDGVPEFPEGRVDWERVVPFRRRLLEDSYRHARSLGEPITGEIARFAEASGNATWLSDWALFVALREKHEGRPWMEWDPRLAGREERALAAARTELADSIAFHTYAQFLFFRQWQRVKRTANARGISVLGDVPIYVAGDSADVWAHRRLFALDADGRPTAMAGVPPDDFSADGQLWGHPVYRWDVLAAEGYDWWIERIRLNLQLADAVRLDHFRGFSAYWEVPAGAATARDGRWVNGPGVMLFMAIQHALGDVALVAEDLGVLTDEVRHLLEVLRLPGMKVLQFAFGETDSEHLPHHHVPNGVVYTGTHDNDTTRGWFAALDDGARARFCDYLGTAGEDAAWDLIRAAFASVAERAIVPMQDVLGLGTEGRMNVPGRAGQNWDWRAAKDAFSPERAARLRRLATLTGRAVAPR
jgi:4-alpha-glucanotransferase